MHPLATPHLSLTLGLPVPTLGFLQGMPIAVQQYLPLTIPFAILTVVGGINVTESARLAGDNYNARSILMTEAIATMVAGVFGGVSQTTPYIGHPAYKDMGARAAYTLATGVFIGLGGILGYIPFMAHDSAHRLPRSDSHLRRLRHRRPGVQGDSAGAQRRQSRSRCCRRSPNCS